MVKVIFSADPQCIAEILQHNAKFSMALEEPWYFPCHLAGPVSCKVPQHNALSLQKGEFYLMGDIMVLCLTQGGPAPTFSAPSVVDYLFQGTSHGTLRITDVPDHNVQKLFEEVIVALVFTYK